MKATFRLDTDEFLADEGKRSFYNRELFSFLAPGYDRSVRILSLGRDAAWKKQLVSKLPGFERPTCLDIGCGTGDLTFELARRFQGSRIAGLDLTRAMLRVAQDKRESPGTTFTLQDMCNISFRDEAFEVITAGYSIRNAPNLQRAISEVHRLLKPGGVFGYLDFSKPVHHVPQKLQNWVLTGWGIFLGLLLNRNKESFLSIPKTLRSYPDRRKLAAFFESAGLRRIESRVFLLGTELALFEKPKAKN